LIFANNCVGALGAVSLLKVFSDEIALSSTFVNVGYDRIVKNMRQLLKVLFRFQIWSRTFVQLTF